MGRIEGGDGLIRRHESRIGVEGRVVLRNDGGSIARRAEQWYSKMERDGWSD